MPQVTVEINSRSYRLSCGEGEEDHVMALARRIDGHAQQIKTPAEAQTLVMAALMLADEVQENETKLLAMAEQLEQLKESGVGGAPDERIAEMEHAVADMLDKAAAQIESVVEDLEQAL